MADGIGPGEVDLDRSVLDFQGHFQFDALVADAVGVRVVFRFVYAVRNLPDGLADHFFGVGLNLLHGLLDDFHPVAIAGALQFLFGAQECPQVGLEVTLDEVRRPRVVHDDGQ
ncbi:hypothetical protein D9M70_544690 [compost metagenome]